MPAKTQLTRIRHDVSVIKREDGKHGWKCSCGQSSDMPWEPAVAQQQYMRHGEEWENFYLHFLEEKPVQDPVQDPVPNPHTDWKCAHCEKDIILVGEQVRHHDKEYHLHCFKEMMTA